MSLHFITN